MADIGAPTLRVLKTFVASVDKDPDLLHKSELSFFKDYLTKMGATIPEAKKAHAHLPEALQKYVGGGVGEHVVRPFEDVVLVLAHDEQRECAHLELGALVGLWAPPAAHLCGARARRNM